MGSYRRVKLAFDAFRCFYSRIMPKTQISQRSTRSCQSEYLTSAGKGANSYGFSSYSLIPHRLGLRGGVNRNLSNPFLAGGARGFYFVDRYNVQHFKPRGPNRWIQHPRNVLLVVVVMIGSGLFITVHCGKFSITVNYGNFETVPYTKRSHFIALSKSFERMLGESEFEQWKASCKGKILPSVHPESIRVRMIAKDIIDALQKGLKKDQVKSEFSYSLGAPQKRVSEALSETKGEAEEKWQREDKWTEKSRKKGEKRGSRAATSHLDGLNWEVLVVNKPFVNAFCLPGGKIVVFTGLLRHLRSDAEIATILGHEVGHAVARHAAERITKYLWFEILQLILYQFVMPCVVNKMSTLFLRLPFSRRMEMEADYIGLLLLASAGYDPRVAPTVYEKLGKVTRKSALRDYLSTHPSGKKRAQLLAQAQVMEEALTIYKNERASRGIEG
ncbi:hypothetical protein QN277_012089 [Acacia crassicarpa]|uniref:Peptidase M48 domain-containing protein n=1 Tax=Acacia crassicarpa TaxID=499986 RepID=A0AAE1N0E8_9FABA|nr:hypothetical protein QN277_012089 [Acacia crassicarpa]